MKYIYPATLTRETDGRYSVFFADLEGCLTQGEDLYDALCEAQDALGFWLDYLEAEGKNIPQATELEDLKLEEKQIATLIWTDTDLWRAQNARRG